MTRKRKVRNPKPIRQGTAPVVNRRVANKPYKPAKQGDFFQREGGAQFHVMDGDDLPDDAGPPTGMLDEP